MRRRTEVRPRPAFSLLRSLPVAALLAAATGAVPARLTGQEYHVDRDADRRARFLSRAATEEFEGVTERVDGYVLLEGGGLSARTPPEGTSLHFEVDLADLDTGIGLRNRHMRDNYLEVGAHPWAVFDGRLAAVRPTGPDAFEVEATGTFTVHGVGRGKRIPCLVEARGPGYAVRCAFPVTLSEHEVEIPQVMFLKLADEVQVEVSFTLRPAARPQPRENP